MRRWGVLVLAALGGACRGEPVEALPADSAAVETTTLDSGDTSDSLGADSTLPDSTLPDSTLPDSTLPDSTATDSFVADSAGPTDGSIPETSDPACGVTRGAPMVLITVPPAFCIDAREVTAAEYVEFLKASDKPAEPAICDWNAGQFGSVATITADAQPMTGVDWCDAYAYCKWAGKHLCGSRTGAGPTTTEDYSVSQWTVACQNGAAGFLWAPSALAPADGVCNIAGAASAPRVAGTFPNCRGASAPYDRIFDQCGNALEWDQSGCAGAYFGFDAGAGDAATHAATVCGIRGGSYANDKNSGQCKTGVDIRIDTKDGRIGFRCCAGPPL